MLKKLFSTPYVVTLLFVFGAASGIATFLESMYDTQTAWKAVYAAKWFELVMVLLAVLMIGVIIRTAMYKKFGIFLFHIAFIFILIAAGMTRYMGEEGVIHIREGMSEDHMITTKPYLQIQLGETIVDRQLSLAHIGDNHFAYDFDINGTKITISYLDYLPKFDGRLDRLSIKVFYDGEEKTVSVDGGRGWIQPPAEVTLKDKKFLIVWGAKLKQLPFSIKLKDFKLERYPGSRSPSSYSSDVVLLDEGKELEMPYEIYMNHPLTYKEYKLFQSSYDKDERGTILEVNRDPGKWPTYFAYFVLTLGFMLSFFTRGSRFETLRDFLKNSPLSLLLIFSLLTTVSPLRASSITPLQEAYLKNFQKNSSAHAKEFGKLLIQDFGGRIKPLNTEAIDILHKISGKSSLYGLSAEQVMLGMLIDPKTWQKIPMIKIKDPNIKKYLKVDKERKYLSFSDLYDKEGFYRLSKKVDKANRTAESKRGTFARDVIKLDERLNVAYLTYKGVLFKFVPLAGAMDQKWLDLNSAMENPMIDKETRTLLFAYLEEVYNALQTNSWEQANTSLSKIKGIQKKYAPEIVPSNIKIKLEVLYNKLDLFKNLFVFYFVLGLLTLVTAFFSIFTGKRSKMWENLIIILFTVALVIHTVALGLRWYISGHEPWSNSYESLVYIGWSTMLAGFAVFRKSMLALATSLLLTAVIMLVAHLSFINPQMTNLVPVLKSYWLSVHVSVITASYGFLGLGFMLGLMSLVLMVFKSKANRERINEQIRYITAINEISLIIGLAMLTVGNFFGGIWANESWGRYWGWDPKETWALVSIVVYTIVLHLRLIPKLNSIYVLSVASVFAFFSIMMTYFGVNYYLTGMHSYAAPGSSPEIPDFIYYMVAVIVTIAVLAYKKRDVPNIEPNIKD